MTPDMIDAISNQLADEKAPEIPEEPQPSNNSSQSQIHSSHYTAPPSSNDPFSISKNRINGEVRLNVGSSALFEKLNRGKSTVTPIGGGGTHGFSSLETPTGHAAFIGDLISVKEFGGAVTHFPGSIEPPPAPSRKARILHGLGLDSTSDAPPRMQSSLLRSKSRSKGDSEEVDSRSVTISTTISERKRTVSGQPPQLISTGSVAIGAKSLNDPIRRSVRINDRQKQPPNGKLPTSTGNLGVNEGRELKKAKATGTKGRSANSYVGRVVSGNRKHGDPLENEGKEQRPGQGSAPLANTKTGSSERVKEQESLRWLLDLFTKLGSGYFALSHYRCQEAIQIFSSITPSQRDTPWVQAQIGRSEYEQTKYKEAAKSFSKVKTMAPASLEDMEIYSTTLWLLKDEIKLTFLAHEIIGTDRDSPQAWCAVGNTFSLQRDHDRAIKCFKRAIQLDPKFAYAYTLQGLEHISNEEYDKALAAFRGSIAADNRHYQAWYGLGSVFEKQGKYDYALEHYRTAAMINPTNAILVCCIGVILEKQKNLKGALVQFAKSLDLAPENINARFKKAKVLMSLNELHKARDELKILKDKVPDEANIHFTLAQVYKRLKDKNHAIKHFTTALNLDPKVSHPLSSFHPSIIPKLLHFEKQYAELSTEYSVAF